MTKPRSSAYSVGQPLTQFQPQPVVAGRAPATTDKNYEVGQTWVDTAGANVYTLVSVTSGSASWGLSTPAAGAVNDMDGDSGTVVRSLLQEARESPPQLPVKLLLLALPLVLLLSLFMS